MKSIEELYEKIVHNKVSIYGAGYTGKRFFRILKEKGLSGTVDNFVSTTGSDEIIDGLPVICVDFIKGDSNRLVLIAVHESIVREITGKLAQLNISNYIWVTPLLYDVMLGAPIVERERIDIRKIWDVAKSFYGIAVRYLAAEEYYGLRGDGYHIYLKCFEQYGRKTAEKRLEMYKILLKNWDENGYDESKPSALLDDYMIIDGAHRITCALFHRQRYVVCNVYRKTRALSDIHGDEAVLSKEGLKNLNIDDWIVRSLDDANRRIEMQLMKE